MHSNGEKKMKRYLLVWLCLLPLGFVVGQEDSLDFSDTETFYLMCTGELVQDNSDLTIMMCASYIEGAVEAYVLMDDLQRDEPQFCFPAGLRHETIRQAFIKWVEENPDQSAILPRKAVLLVILKLGYGCDKGFVGGE